MDRFTAGQALRMDAMHATYRIPGAASTISLNSATRSVGEADGSVKIRVNRTGITSTTVSVSYATTDVTALAGSDYKGKTGVLTFAPGVTKVVFRVPITNDATHEPSETFLVSISDPSPGANLGANTTTEVTIVDDDH